MDSVARTPDAREPGAAAKRTMIPLTVYLLSFSLFAMGSAEFLMGGILPQIASDLDLTLPTAGALISAFAVGALIGAPPLAILTLRWPKRFTLLASQVVFVLATIMSLVSQEYAPVLIWRFVMGLAYACFWAAAAATAVQLSGKDRSAKALATVVSGLTLAMIFGGPAGTFISESQGWRSGFWVIVAATSLAAFLLLFAMTRNPSTRIPVPSVASELRAMARPQLWVAFAVTATTTAAYMGIFAYLAALLLEVSSMPPSWLPGVLALFGVGAFVGLAIGGRTADRHPTATLTSAILGLALTCVGMSVFASELFVEVLLVFALGVMGFLLNPAVWRRVYVLAPDAPTLAGATNSSAFQLGLTAAPLLTGLPISLEYGVESIGWVGAVVSLIALGLANLDKRMSRT